MSPCKERSVRGPIGFPRVSGDEPRLQRLVRKLLGFSPREWG